MGFGSKWINWICSCLKSASISVLINGSPTSEFSLGRGIRQGDPLSPFLFILAGEGLNIMSKMATEKGLFKGVEIGDNKVPLSHLQYADDTIFIGEWTRSNAYSLQNLLKCFELASGLKVNFNKSCIYGIGVNSDEINHVASRLNCKVGSFPFTYLGLPIGEKMSKRKNWDIIVEKIKSRLSSWKMRSLSSGGRIVLIKSILNSLPLYFFSLFRAPKCVLKLLEDVRREFFWGGSDTSHKISWVKWEKVVSPYESGGLNLGTEITELGIPFRDSFFKKVGDGSSTSFWNDNWTGKGRLSIIFPRLHRLDMADQASVLDRLEWAADGPKFRPVWAREPRGRANGELAELEKIIEDYNFDRDKKDEWKWSLSSNGNFTVKSLTSIIYVHFYSGISSSFESMRNKLLPKKIEIFVWRATQKRLPVRNELDKRGIDLDTVRCPLCDSDIETVDHALDTVRCPLCDSDIETVDHALLLCNKALEIWNRVSSWWGFNLSPTLTLNEILRGNGPSNLTENGKCMWQAVAWVCTYLIWVNRNNVVFRGKGWSTPVAINEIQVKSFEWLSHRSRGRKLDWLTWLCNPDTYLN
ncbi:uncharacterized protein [Rutidosis leptorrhynchoides]|uniref:uncharacterized protein n=1 Tax=Rutidosis leptorrhynchoides TaxID=125765 RepID=UPI003A998602